MTKQRYRVSDRPQRTPGALGDDRDWFAPGTEVTRDDRYGLDNDGEWRVLGPALATRGDAPFGYIRPDALDPITETTDLPDVRFLNAALALYEGPWTPTGEAILEIIEQARKMQEVLEP